MHLADVGAGLGAPRIVHMGETQGSELWIAQALLAEVGTQAAEALGIATVVDPGRAHIAQPLAHVDLHIGVGVRA
ncbi:hypothetical protein D3C81_1654700 [compost metagenome]